MQAGGSEIKTSAAEAPLTVVVITGPTASGKTAVAIEVARALGTEIISADSRQIFRGLPIGTAAPTPEQLAAVKHHLVATLDLDQYYSAALFEEDSLAIIERLRRQGKRHVVVCGGSMMYVDALCRGIDALPTISDEVRLAVMEMERTQGLQAVMQRLQQLDPEYAAQVEPRNRRRVMHALEICLQAGVPYSTLRTGQPKKRPFNIVKFALQLPREEMFVRINARVDAMMEQGLEAEARAVQHLRHLNSLNTVGYKEMFAYFDGTFTLPQAVARIQKNTRVFAKKQLTRLAADSSIIAIDASAATTNPALAILAHPALSH